MTTHAGCRMYLPTECNFGILQPIYLPPHSVSIPRTEVPIEAIIGVQVKSKTSLVRDYSCRKYQSGPCTRKFPVIVATWPGQGQGSAAQLSSAHSLTQNSPPKSCSSISSRCCAHLYVCSDPWIIIILRFLSLILLSSPRYTIANKFVSSCGFSFLLNIFTLFLQFCFHFDLFIY